MIYDEILKTLNCQTKNVFDDVFDVLDSDSDYSMKILTKILRIPKNNFVFLDVIAYPVQHCLASMDRPIRLHDDVSVHLVLEEIVEAQLFVHATMEAKGIDRIVDLEERGNVLMQVLIGILEEVEVRFDAILAHLRWQSLLLHCCHEWDWQVSCSNHFHDRVLLGLGSNSSFFRRIQCLFLFFVEIVFSSHELVEVHVPMLFLVFCNENSDKLNIFLVKIL